MEVVLYLPLKSIIALTTVSKTFNAIAMDPIVWQDLYFRTPGYRIHRSAGHEHDLVPMSPYDALHTPGSSVKTKMLHFNGSDRSSGRWGEHLLRSSPLNGRSLNRIELESAGLACKKESPSAGGSSQVKSDFLAAIDDNASPSSSLLATATTALKTTSISPCRDQSPNLSLNIPYIANAFNTPHKTPASRAVVGLRPLDRIRRPLNWREVYKERVKLDRRWREGKPETRVKIEAHDEAVYCVQILHDRLVTGSRDKHVKIWSIGFGDGNAPQLVHDIADVHTKSVLCLNVEEGTGCDGGGMMICGSSDCNISVWELLGALYPKKTPGGLAKPAKVAVLTGHKGGVLDVAWNKERIVSW